MIALDEPPTVADDLRDELAQLLAEGAGDDCAWYPSAQAIFEEDLYSEELTALCIAVINKRARPAELAIAASNLARFIEDKARAFVDEEHARYRAEMYESQR